MFNFNINDEPKTGVKQQIVEKMSFDYHNLTKCSNTQAFSKNLTIRFSCGIACHFIHVLCMNYSEKKTVIIGKRQD